MGRASLRRLLGLAGTRDTLALVLLVGGAGSTRGQRDGQELH